MQASDCCTHPVASVANAKDVVQSVSRTWVRRSSSRPRAGVAVAAVAAAMAQAAVIAGAADAVGVVDIPNANSDGSPGALCCCTLTTNRYCSDLARERELHSAAVN